MDTESQMIAEAAWRAEIVPVEMGYLARNLRNHYGLSIDAVGMRGNTAHRRGYHRSRRWILESKFCTDRRYSVTETPSNMGGGNFNWVCAIDITLPLSHLLPACRRLDIDVRAGRLEKVAEWYGNLDGDTRVDGYNNIANHPATSDNSHLWHLHISFVRGHANDNHADVFRTLTGVGWDAPDVPSPPTTPPDLEWTETAMRNLPELRMGVTGMHVRSAQGLLTARGFSTPIDGTFGPDMRTKTLALQKHYGAEHIDGIFGPETWTIALLGEDLR